MAHLSTKTYGNERGLSCTSRQWAAESDCHLLHGYSFGFHFVFAAEQLDKRGWVLDFGKGGFGQIRDWLHEMFDHTLLVAKDDPEREALVALGERGIARVRVVEGTSCERVAEMTFHKANEIVQTLTKGRCWVESVECSEHGSNSGIYRSTEAQVRLIEADRLRNNL
ncbi:6-carboxytetrahydropterin synthase [Maricaulis sp.]|uniref:6-pyruvoyl trahydropterin synthase family protein n=1 Tax=unclassified Maricaulis TaxID=2632371 RepID=UPI001B12E9BB|nr:6-carboxytetrahydropterin synthase [Maricaulis sp.]MBO6797915.1 6-carboxytetrahydropterin synthase [Maricaulis sp.]